MGLKISHGSSFFSSCSIYFWKMLLKFFFVEFKCVKYILCITMRTKDIGYVEDSFFNSNHNLYISQKSFFN